MADDYPEIEATLRRLAFYRLEPDAPLPARDAAAAEATAMGFALPDDYAWFCSTQGAGAFDQHAMLPLPPGCTDLEIGWQLTPAAWGHGYGAEAGHAVAHQAFAKGVSEVFAVVRPGNTRGAATARRVGMEWVGETDKYYGLTMQVYRLAAPDLDYPEATVGMPQY